MSKFTFNSIRYSIFDCFHNIQRLSMDEYSVLDLHAARVIDFGHLNELIEDLVVG